MEEHHMSVVVDRKDIQRLLDKAGILVELSSRKRKFYNQDFKDIKRWTLDVNMVGIAKRDINPEEFKEWQCETLWKAGEPNSLTARLVDPVVKAEVARALELLRMAGLKVVGVPSWETNIVWWKNRRGIDVWDTVEDAGKMKEMLRMEEDALRLLAALG
jgi:hypothetical protein